MYVLNKNLDGGADTYYMQVPVAGRVIKAQTVVDQQDVATAEKTITLSDGTTDIGVITAAVDATEGDVDTITFDSTSEGKVRLDEDTPLKIVLAGAGNGKFNLSVVIDTFHAA